MFANWFGKRGRGTIIGFWQSCGNFGNVTGALTTSFLTSTLLLEWEYAYMYVGFACVGMAVVNFFMLIVHPEEKDIVIYEIDDQTHKNEEMLRRHTLAKENTSINTDAEE